MILILIFNFIVIIIIVITLNLFIYFYYFFLSFLTLPYFLIPRSQPTFIIFFSSFPSSLSHPHNNPTSPNFFLIFFSSHFFPYFHFYFLLSIFPHTHNHVFLPPIYFSSLSTPSYTLLSPSPYLDIAPPYRQHPSQWRYCESTVLSNAIFPTPMAISLFPFSFFLSLSFSLSIYLSIYLSLFSLHQTPIPSIFILEA